MHILLSVICKVVHLHACGVNRQMFQQVGPLTPQPSHSQLTHPLQGAPLHQSQSGNQGARQKGELWGVKDPLPFTLLPSAGFSPHVRLQRVREQKQEQLFVLSHWLISFRWNNLKCCNVVLAKLQLMFNVLLNWTAEKRFDCESRMVDGWLILISFNHSECCRSWPGLFWKMHF